MSIRSFARRGSFLSSFFGTAGALALAALPAAQVGTVQAEVKISETAGGFGGDLGAGNNFGYSAAGLGDLNGDGTRDVAVGALADGDGGSLQGAVWILFLNADGTVCSQQKISETAGGFGGVLDPGDLFGTSVAALGDLDGDGIGDLAVGATNDDDGGRDQGAIWILFLNSNGTVSSELKISATAGGFGGPLDPGDRFGASIAAFGDLDGDGIVDLAVGADGDDDVLRPGHVRLTGDIDQGAVWILFLNSNGTVSSQQKVSETTGGFTGLLSPEDEFGTSVASLGDLDGDGTADLAVGAKGDDDGGTDQGAVWILFLDSDGTVSSQQKLSEAAGGFAGVLAPSDVFGTSLASLGDLDSDGIGGDLAVGASTRDDGEGAVWILFLNADGTVSSQQKIGGMTGGFGGVLDAADLFGTSVASLGDLDGDGTVDLVVGAEGDDDGDVDQGAVWMLSLVGPDTMAPVLSCPPLVSELEPKNGTPGETVFFSVTASDDVDPAPSVVCVPPSGSLFPRGTTIVNCLATDASGNQSTCMFPVVVLPPVRERRL